MTICVESRNYDWTQVALSNFRKGFNLFGLGSSNCWCWEILSSPKGSFIASNPIESSPQPKQRSSWMRRQKEFNGKMQEWNILLPRISAQWYSKEYMVKHSGDLMLFCSSKAQGICYAKLWGCNMASVARAITVLMYQSSQVHLNMKHNSKFSFCAMQLCLS